MNEIKDLIEKSEFTIAELLELKDLIDYKIGIKDLQIASRFNSDK